jgi:predicted CXXCH cytochrome family protein
MQHRQECLRHNLDSFLCRFARKALPGSLAGLAITLLCFAADAPGPGFLRPLDETIAPAGPLVVVARTAGKAELRLDGKVVSASQPAPNVITATVNPAPGSHELALGDQKIRFFVRTAANASSAPAGWGEFKTHPPAATCETCHALKDGAWSLKTDPVADTCFGCHDAKPFPAIHSHNSEVLGECQMCHSAHGSTAKAHLKMKKELACKQCHG